MKKVEIRRATAEDFATIRDLLSIRDGKAWDLDDLRWVLCDMRKDACVAWLAFANGEPVGFTNLYLRELHWKNQSHCVGYWANLFVHPDHGNLMLYPRLPQAMFAWADAAGIAMIYASVRRSNVARAHVAIGFHKCGELPVFVKPIRPFRALVRHKVQGSLWGGLAAQLAKPLDCVFSTFQRLKTGMMSQSAMPVRLPFSEESLNEALANLLNACCDSFIAQRWSAELICQRYKQSAHGEHYFAVIDMQEDTQENECNAAIIYRTQTLENGMHACVLLEAVARQGADQSLRQLLARVTECARQQGCEMLLSLITGDQPTQTVLNRSGFWGISESYQVLVWPKQTPHRLPWCAEIENWRFALGDHDAF